MWSQQPCLQEIQNQETPCMELNQNHHYLPVFASFLIASYLAVDEERVLEASRPER